MLSKLYNLFIFRHFFDLTNFQTFFSIFFFYYYLKQNSIMSLLPFYSGSLNLRQLTSLSLSIVFKIFNAIKSNSESRNEHKKKILRVETPQFP